MATRRTFAMIGFMRPTTTILSLLLLQLALYRHNLVCHSFQQSPMFMTTRSASASSSTHTTHFYADPSSSNIHDQTPPPPSFEQRMRQQLRQQKNASTSTTIKATTTTTTTKLVPDIRNLKDYKDVLDKAGDDDKMLAVLWYSPWCKACRAVIPGIRTLAKRHPDIQFIQVPVIAENANLHQGLDVPSVPFMHLYVPEDPRLVEESKMTRKRLSAFQKLLRDYEAGSCSLENDLGETESDGEGSGGGEESSSSSPWSTLCPYSFPTNSRNTNTVASSRTSTATP